MAKRALCVGINDYPIRGMDLKGCVNDAKSWAAALTQHFDFAPGDVTLVLDAGRDEAEDHHALEGAAPRRAPG